MKWVVRIVAGLFVLIVSLAAALWLWGMRPSHGHLATEVVIERPASQVFRWLTDDDRVKRWIGGLLEIRDTFSPSDGAEVGRKFHLVEEYKGSRAEMDMTVLRYEKDHDLEILVSSTGDPKNGFTETANYTLSEENGKTRLRFTVDTTYFGFMLRLLEPIITPQADKKLREDLQHLKELVESEPAT
jgi:uncharacterized protein YndB with AHSA1/START domain